MIAFTVVINTIVNYNYIFPPNGDNLMMQQDLARVMDSYSLVRGEEPVTLFIYEWGDVEVEIKEMTSELFYLIFTARAKEGNKSISHKRILMYKDE